MIKYTKKQAEEIIQGFVQPCLENMLDPDTDPDVIILPEKRNGLAVVFDDLDEARTYSIDDPDNETYFHGIENDTLYKILFTNMGFWTQDITDIKVCYLKDGNLRIRFKEETTTDDRDFAVNKLKNVIEREADQDHTPQIVYNPLVWGTATEEKKGEKKKMNDFSLTNLKDALVNKITHLDKKTVTILALIALVLLIVGKYQDIKDILIGIKDKVKRSKNFKAMVADGTAAIDSLKKIVGVKDNKKETVDEA